MKSELFQADGRIDGQTCTCLKTHYSKKLKFQIPSLSTLKLHKFCKPQYVMQSSIPNVCKFVSKNLCEVCFKNVTRMQIFMFGMWIPKQLIEAVY